MIKYIAIIAILVTGCTVQPYQWKHAEDLCELNGGIESVYPHLEGVDITCNNGATFENQRPDP